MYKLVGQVDNKVHPDPVVEEAKQKCFKDGTYKCEYGEWVGCDTVRIGYNDTSRGVWINKENKDK